MDHFAYMFPKTTRFPQNIHGDRGGEYSTPFFIYPPLRLPLMVMMMTMTVSGVGGGGGECRKKERGEGLIGI